MPELPEVETIARSLRPLILGRRLGAVSILLEKSLPEGREWLPRLAGATITHVLRRAKLLLVLARTLDPLPLAGHSGKALPAVEPAAERAARAFLPAHDPARTLALAFHLKMTGGLLVHPAGTSPSRHTRIIFDLLPALERDASAVMPDTSGGSAFDDSDGSASGGNGRAAPETPRAEAAASAEGRLFFDDVRTFGYCRILPAGDLPRWPFWAGLGPEPLQTPPAELAERFSRHRRAIKAVLLDQTVVAGVGNIYADEALFAARIHPSARAGSLELPRLAGLAEALRAVLRLSIEQCGSSIRDYRDAGGNAGAFQNSFSVYSRKGLPCPVCGRPLDGGVVAGRSTVFCPFCQKT